MCCNAERRRNDRDQSRFTYNKKSWVQIGENPYARLDYFGSSWRSRRHSESYSSVLPVCGEGDDGGFQIPDERKHSAHLGCSCKLNFLLHFPENFMNNIEELLLTKKY